MDPDFWHQRWAQGRIGFHQASYNPHLLRFGPRMAGGRPSNVLVPLSGKSKDLKCLADAGHQVVAVELVPSAAEAFYAEEGIEMSQRVDGHPILSGGNIQTHVTDFFALAPSAVPKIDWIFDRAALVALPEPVRARYVEHLLGFLPQGGEILLVTFAYDQTKTNGPPFSVPDEEVEARFGPHGALERWHTEDILGAMPRFDAAGLSWLTTSVWHFRKSG